MFLVDADSSTTETKGCTKLDLWLYMQKGYAIIEKVVPFFPSKGAGFH